MSKDSEEIVGMAIGVVAADALALLAIQLFEKGILKK